jgi:hypothetical protein
MGRRVVEKRNLGWLLSLQPRDRNSENSGHRTILLVEDDPFVREATCGILERAGFKVLPAPWRYEGSGRARRVGVTDKVSRFQSFNVSKTNSR